MLILKKDRTIYHRELMNLAVYQNVVADDLFARVGSVRRIAGLYAIYAAYGARMTASRTVGERRELARDAKSAIISFSRVLYNEALAAARQFVQRTNSIIVRAVNDGYVTGLEPLGNSGVGSNSNSNLDDVGGGIGSVGGDVIEYIALNEDNLNFWDVYLAFLDGQFALLETSGYIDSIISTNFTAVSASVNLTNMINSTINAINQATVSGSGSGSGSGIWYKQVIAVIDNRTTDCCLQATGQIVAWNSKFHLTGVPHYAEFMDWVPFHRWCRSSCIAIPQSLIISGITPSLILGA